MITVRQLTWCDYQGAFDLRSKLVKHELELDQSLTPSDMAASVFDTALCTASWLRSPSVVVFGAFDGDEMVGFLSIESGPVFGFGKEMGAKVGGFYVLPEYRSRGVAGMLYAKARKFAKAIGVGICQAFVLWKNMESRTMMEKRGFRIVAVVYERDES